jgi:localization factor PodJL
MNTKRSYIESLNAGRPRREHATLEDLNRSLASLDERFSRNLQEAEQGSGEEDIAARMRRISEEISRRDAAAPAVRTGTDFVPDFERERARESGVASMSKIASELNTLREELRSRLENASAMAGAADPRPDFQFHPGQTPRASASDDHVIAGIVDRLEQIHAAVGNLPDSLSISSLEEKVKTLAAAVEHLARQKEMPGATTFDAIEERLDEISRAIVASAQPVPGFDNGHLERIEARIASLSRQLEELVEDRPADAVMKQLSALSARVEEIAGRAELPETSVDHLSRQIDLIVEKLEGGAKAVDPEVIFQGMEKRFETLTQALEQRHESAREQSVALFRDLEERLERYNQEALSTDAAIVEALNKRFSDLEEAVARRGSDPAALAGTLSQPAGRMPEFDDIGPRLELIERSVIESREAIIVAARAAAEHAVRSRDLPEGDAAVLSGLAEELGSLEKLARRSDERNSRTFEAIHDTLLQIVDRLADLESGAGSTSGAATGSVMKEAPARKLEFAEAPSLDMPSLGGMEEAEPLPQGLL